MLPLHPAGGPTLILMTAAGLETPICRGAPTPSASPWATTPRAPAAGSIAASDHAAYRATTGFGARIVAFDVDAGLAC